MARPLRDKTAGIFHVTAHGVRDTALFRDDLDRVRFLTELAAITARAKWTCIQFCLMTTHYHLLLDVADDALPFGMHALNFRYACSFNSRHGTRGHVTERRYSADRITTDGHLLYAYRYIARNPAVARLCSRSQDWPWSSYAGTIGAAEANTFVDAGCILDLFANVPRLREFVEES